MKRVGLDTNIFMGIFQEEKEKLDPSLKILNFIYEGRLEGVISSITLIEIAILFYKNGEEQKAKKAVNLIRTIPNTTIVDITSDIVLDIALIKVSEKLAVADAIILSAVTELSSDVFLTYDNDFVDVKKIRCMKPEDYLKIIEEEGA